MRRSNTALSQGRGVLGEDECQSGTRHGDVEVGGGSMVCAEGHAPNLAQDERCCSSLECGQAVDGDVPGEAHKFNAKNLL